MEDIDDLLDEVENKFVHGKGSSKPGKKENESKRNASVKEAKASQKPGKSMSAVDDLISDILDVDIDDNSQSKQAPTKSCSSTTSMCSGAGKVEQAKQCFPVFLGGSADEVGRGTTVNVRVCNQLRCTSCDFRVCCFDNFSWTKDTDYLFLRNNVPNLDKLRSKLGRKKGSRAYCCQCCWKNVSELTELKDPNLKWVCGKHVS